MMLHVSDISISAELCKRCGICIAFCPKDVFVATRDGLPKVVALENCINCRLCELRCPDFAISLEVDKNA